MSPTQILFAKSDSILALGVVSILKRENDSVIFETQLDPDSSLPITDPKQPPPDVVIVDVGMNTPAHPQLSQFIEQFPQTPIIAVNGQANWVMLYHQGETLITAPAELVSAVRHIRDRKGGL